MNKAFFAFAAITSLALFGCSAETGSDADLQTAAQSTCVSAAQARATYDRQVKAAMDRVQASFAAALAKHDQEVQDAAATRDQELASLPTDDHSSDLYNKVIIEYNAKVGADGTIQREYDAAVAAAQTQYNTDVEAAKDTYYSSMCR
jgi:hypothetical protein